MEIIRTKNQKERVFEIFEHAFISSPGMNWMLRNRNSERGKRWIINLMFHEGISQKGAFITSDNNGAVLFFQVQKKAFTPLNIFRTLYILGFVTGIKNGIRALRYKKMVATIRPKTGWLGLLVATDRTAEGSGAAFEIKREMFRLADESNECIYVETTVPRVRTLYKAAGYIEYAEMQHPYADLKIWFFRRDPFTYSRKKSNV
ncbi:MAG: hypothetical protein ACI837_002790 [Crocinitomicaceae bacterium]|jgi:hypothetical protein